MHLTFTLRILSLLLPTLALAGGPNENKPATARDTSSAVVVYNADTRFIPEAAYTPEDYAGMIDSLVRLENVPVSLVNQLNVYLHLSKRPSADLSQVIDSLFELPSVPQPVLNAVNLYMGAMQRAMEAPTGFAAFIPADGSAYPANYFYKHWNTVVPYPERNSLTQFDTLLTLLLVDEEKNCGFHMPSPGIVTSHFGWRYGRNHNGTDIDLQVWDPVKAVFPGVVRVASNYKGYGRVVVIRHYNGLETLYAHLHRFKCKTGDEVEAGEVIGLGGSSGNSTGSHLHFEVRFQGVPIKPSAIIDFKNKTLRTEKIGLRKSGAFLAVVQPEPKNLNITTRIYQVQKGDYLYKIATENGTTVEKLCEINRIHKSEPLTVGQKLRLGA